MRIAFIVLAAAVGAAAVVPVQASATLPLADIRLVSEKAASFTELAAAQKNGRNGQNGNSGGGTYGGRRGYYVFQYVVDGYFHARGTPSGNGELGDLDGSADEDLVAVDLR